MTTVPPVQPAAPPASNGATPAVVVYAQRDRARSMVRTAFPRRKTRVVLTRTAADFEAAFRANLVDAAIVDVGGAQEDTWRAAAFAREFPTVPFFGLAPLRVAEGPALAQCVVYEFADMLVDGVDDEAARDLVARASYTTRFAAALDEPPRALTLDTPLQRAAWRFIVSHAGRPVRTSTLAQFLKVTREHLSRSFAAGGAPNLKRIIDLVRIVAAAELAKNPGYDLRDVAAILEFASSSHLSSTAMRVIGTKPASLTRLRTVDLVERFTKGHGRSRG
jgi:AraC-like DNA-binding protein